MLGRLRRNYHQRVNDCATAAYSTACECYAARSQAQDSPANGGLYLSRSELCGRETVTEGLRASVCSLRITLARVLYRKYCPELHTSCVRGYCEISGSWVPVRCVTEVLHKPFADRTEKLKRCKDGITAWPGAGGLTRFGLSSSWAGRFSTPNTAISAQRRAYPIT